MSNVNKALRGIRTVEELEALDPETFIVDSEGDTWHVLDAYVNEVICSIYTDCLPVMVIATGDQVRAAREALEEEDV